MSVMSAEQEMSVELSDSWTDSRTAAVGQRLSDVEITAAFIQAGEAATEWAEYSEDASKDMETY